MTGHALKRVISEYDEDHAPKWRWLCACGRKGTWNHQSPGAATTLHREHAQKYSTKGHVVRDPAPGSGYADLQRLLSFTYPAARD